MDEQRFDAALRALGRGASRRNAIAGVLGALLGSSQLASAAGGRRPDGSGRGTGKHRKQPGTEGPCGDGSRKANSCSRDSDCCTDLCNLNPSKKNRDKRGRCRCVHQGSACKADRNCCGGMSCTKGRCASGGGDCASNGDCPAASPICSEGFCVQCVAAGDCGRSADTCAGGICTCGGSAPCTGSTKICNAGVCAACATNDDCSGDTPTCDGGTCRARAWTNKALIGAGGSNDCDLLFPEDVAVSNDGATGWIANPGRNNVVTWFYPDLEDTTRLYFDQLGTQGTGNSNLSSPQGVWLSSDQLTLWIADYSNNRIVIWTRPDTSCWCWSYHAQFGSYGSGDSNLYQPSGIWVSEDELTAFIADHTNNRIVVWSRPDAASTAWAYHSQFGSLGTGDTNLSGPWKVWASPDLLTVWVPDYFNNRVSIWSRAAAADTAWSFKTKFGSQGFGDDNINNPFGVWVSDDGLSAWVSDSSNARIVNWTRPDSTSTNWTFKTKFGSSGTGPENFTAPAGLRLSSDQKTAWIADNVGLRISVWTYS